jgi:hypothetical protein
MAGPSNVIETLPVGCGSGQGLRDRARHVTDAGDQATMLRLGSEYERQAAELDCEKHVPAQ